MSINNPKTTKIVLENIGKRFRFEWIFKNVSLTFEQGKRYALLGHNGSGKSTLMQLISGFLTPSKGSLRCIEAEKGIDLDDFYTKISYAAPYIDLIEEFTLQETIDFHQKFKPFSDGFDTQKVMERLNFPKGNTHKQVRYFSSGMKQRLKLALALCSNTPIILLDEPTTNLDAQGVEWYRALVLERTQDKLLIVASNIPQDYDFCDEEILVENYK
ncbi:MAG: hypothetical protein RI894_795 [Bacteroidota bacterium]